MLFNGTNGGSSRSPSAVFALLNLGLIESIANGMVTPDEANRLFYNAENCLYVRKHLRQKIAAEIMSRGTQLPDLFDALPVDDALREFHHELATIRSLCLRLAGKEETPGLKNAIAGLTYVAVERHDMSSITLGLRSRLPNRESTNIVGNKSKCVPNDAVVLGFCQIICGRHPCLPFPPRRRTNQNTPGNWPRFTQSRANGPR